MVSGKYDIAIMLPKSKKDALNILALCFLIAFISISSLSLINTDYYFMSPGPPYQWEIEYESIKDRITENISDNENFKWLICENNNCEFWTREPKR